MRVTAEMSLYPLQGQPLPKILAFIAEIASDARLEVVVNQLSTQVRGELGVVMAVLTAAVERSFGEGGAQDGLLGEPVRHRKAARETILVDGRPTNQRINRIAVGFEHPKFVHPPPRGAMLRWHVPE